MSLEADFAAIAEIAEDTTIGQEERDKQIGDINTKAITAALSAGSAFAPSSVIGGTRFQFNKLWNGVKWGGRKGLGFLEMVGGGVVTASEKTVTFVNTVHSRFSELKERNQNDRYREKGPKDLAVDIRNSLKECVYMITGKNNPYPDEISLLSSESESEADLAPEPELGSSSNNSELSSNNLESNPKIDSDAFVRSVIFQNGETSISMKLARKKIMQNLNCSEEDASTVLENLIEGGFVKSNRNNLLSLGDNREKDREAGENLSNVPPDESGL